MNNRETISQLLRLEKDFHYKRVTQIVEENIGIDKDVIYFYECRGSGYYLKFLKVSGETVIFNIYSKGGKLKKERFYINWYGIPELRVYKAG